MILLTINGIEAVIDSKTTFPFTFRFEDLTNPAATQNSFTKTVSLPACPVNDAIFGHIWSLDQVATNFDPRVRTPFVLEVNGAVFETGYLKLSEVSYANGRPTAYSVNLYGGLGSFFYALAEKDLQDIEYPNNLSHIINKDTIFDLPGKARPYMAYMLAYNGKYANFQSDVYDPIAPGDPVPIGPRLWSNMNTEGKEFDEHQVQEFRSYYQRPALKVSEMISRIVSASGLTVNLSPEFFSSANPYWVDTFLSLPQYEIEDSLTVTGGVLLGQGQQMAGYTQAMQQAATITDSNRSGELSMYVFSSENEDIIDSTNDILKISSLSGALRIGIWLQIGIIATSGANQLKGKYRIGKSSSIGLTPSMTSKINFQVGITNTDGSNFQLVGGGNYDLSDVFFDLPYSESAGSTARGYKEAGGQKNFLIPIPENIGYIGGVMAGDKKVVVNYSFITTGSELMLYGSFNNIPATLTIGLTGSRVEVNTYNSIRSDSRVNYSDMMPTGTTQLNMLLSYCQAFGLLFDRDRVTDEITIMTRNEYFDGYKVLDWTNKIDHGKGGSLTPLNFAYKYGILKWAESPTHYCEKYKEKYNIDYGSIRLDTGYKFDNSEEEWMSNNVLQNAVMSCEYDNFFIDRNPDNNNRDNKVLPALFELSDNEREATDCQFSLFFDNGVPSGISAIRVSDDTENMQSNNQFMWLDPGDNNNGKFYDYRQYSRITADGSRSLDFAKPRISYYPEDDVNYPESATIYARFWQKWIEERLSIDTRVWRPYVYLTASEVSQFRHNQFVQIENTLWFVNEIADFDPTQNQSVRVTLVRVNDISAYTDGQAV